ncbi:unnamed protein product, partial [Prunus brigantina]
ERERERERERRRRRKLRTRRKRIGGREEKFYKELDQKCRFDNSENLRKVNLVL